MKKIVVLVCIMGLACGVFLATTIPAFADTGKSIPAANVQEEPVDTLVEVEQEFVAPTETKEEPIVEMDDGSFKVGTSSEEVIVLEDGTEIRISCSEMYYFPEAE